MLRTLRTIWKAVVSPGSEPSEPSKMQLRENKRAYFRVTDKQAAKSLAHWLERRESAEDEVHAYLKRVAGVIGAETPFYKIDADGYVESINFRFWVPFTHPGWKGKNNTNWLVPEDDQTKAEVRSLPPLPSYSEVNTLLDWPEAKIDKCFQDMHLPGYEDFAVRAARQVRVSRSAGEIFVSVPFPDTFADYPALAEQVQHWRPPQGFEQIDPAAGRRIERTASFGRSPLGSAVAKGLQYLNRQP